MAAVSEKGGFWLFPNLFEDCGVIDSFKPLYGFGETECYSFLKKQKRKKRSQSKKKKWYHVIRNNKFSDPSDNTIEEPAMA